MIASHMPPHQGPGAQPKHVPWLGIEPVTLWFTGWLSIHWATPARAHCGIPLNCIFSQYFFLYCIFPMQVLICFIYFLRFSISTFPSFNALNYYYKLLTLFFKLFCREHCISYLFWCYHKSSGLKQHILVISQFQWVRCLSTASSVPLLPGLPGCSQAVSQGYYFIRCLTGGGSAFQLNKVACKTSFLAGRLTEDLIFLLTIAPSPPCFVSLSIWHGAHKMVSCFFKASKRESLKEMGYNLM